MTESLSKDNCTGTGQHPNQLQHNAVEDMQYFFMDNDEYPRNAMKDTGGTHDSIVRTVTRRTWSIH